MYWCLDEKQQTENEHRQDTTGVARDSWQQIAKLSTTKLPLLSVLIEPSPAVFNLDMSIDIDNQLTIVDHVARLCRSCLFQQAGRWHGSLASMSLCKYRSSAHLLKLTRTSVKLTGKLVCDVAHLVSIMYCPILTSECMSARCRQPPSPCRRRSARSSTTVVYIPQPTPSADQIVTDRRPTLS